MRRINLYPLCLLLLAACEPASVDAPATTDDTPGDVLRVASISLQGETATRSIITGIETDPVNGGSNTDGKISRLGMYAVCADGTEYKPMNGRNTAVYVKSSDKWQPDASLTGDENLRLSATEVYVYAWHPSTLSPSYASGSFHVSGIDIKTTDSFDATAQTDYLYAAGNTDGATDGKTAVTSQQNPGLKFRMKHALAKLTFRIKKDDTTSETLTLKQLILKGSGNSFLTGSGTNRRMALANGVLSGLVATEKLTYSGTLELDASGQDVIILVAPVTGVQRLGLELTVDFPDVARKFQTKALSVATTWESGKNYVYNVNVNKMSASISEVPAVYDWTEETNDIPIQ